MRAPRTVIVLLVGTAVGCEQLLGVHDIKGAANGDAATGSGDSGNNQGLCAPAPHFAASTQYVIPTSQFSKAELALGDLNNDGVVDAAIALGSDVVVLNGDGNGAFHPYHALDAVATPAFVISIADIDGDGLNDVITCGGNSVYVRRQDRASPGHFLAAVTSSQQCPMFDDGSLTTATFNSDGYTDLLVEPGGSAYGAVMLGDGSGGFTFDFTTPRVMSVSIVAADIDGDGFDDLLIDGREIRYNQGGSAGSFDPPVMVGGTNNGVVGVGRYSGSAQGLDIIAHADTSSGVLFAHTAPRAFEQRSDVFAGPLVAGNQYAAPPIDATDLNGDGLEDLVGLYTGFPQGSAQSSAVLQCSPGVFDPAPGSSVTLRYGSPSGALARKFADIDGNRKPDLIEISVDGQYLVVWRQ